MTLHIMTLASFHGIDMVSGRVPFLFFVCSALFAACGGSDPIDDASGQTMSLNMRSEVNAGRLELRVDINLDGNPDLWEFFDVYDSEGSHIVDEAVIASESGEDLRLVERHIDTNLDTRVDIVRFYSGRQLLERELLDIDFDGVLDYTNIYRNGILAERRTDVDGNEVPEEVRFYRGGNLARIESDADGDGRLEFYEYFRENELTHYGIDRDGDGTVDEWTRRQGTMARLSRPGLPASNAPVDPNGATPTEGSAAGGTEEQPAPDVEGSGALEAPVVQGENDAQAAEPEPESVPSVDTAVPAETAPSEGSSIP